MESQTGEISVGRCLISINMTDDISGGVGINVLICAAVSLQACSPVWSVLLSNIDFVFMSRGTNNDEQTRDQSQLTLDL